MATPVELRPTSEGLRAAVDLGAGLEESAQIVAQLGRQQLACDFAGIVILEGSTIRSLGATDPLVQRAVEIEFDLGEGPGHFPEHGGPPRGSPGLSDDVRWKAWGAAVFAIGLRSLLAVPIAVGPSQGSLCLYSARLRDFSFDELSAALTIAQEGSVVLNNAAHLDRLGEAIEGRTVIGQAQGMLMERFGIDAEPAFAILLRYSQDTNVKLNVIAADFVHHRSLPLVVVNNNR